MLASMTRIDAFLPIELLFDAAVREWAFQSHTG